MHIAYFTQLTKYMFKLIERFQVLFRINANLLFNHVQYLHFIDRVYWLLESRASIQYSVDLPFKMNAKCNFQLNEINHIENAQLLIITLRWLDQLDGGGGWKNVKRDVAKLWKAVERRTKKIPWITKDCYPAKISFNWTVQYGQVLETKRISWSNYFLTFTLKLLTNEMFNWLFVLLTGILICYSLAHRKLDAKATLFSRNQFCSEKWRNGLNMTGG